MTRAHGRLQRLDAHSEQARIAYSLADRFVCSPNRQQSFPKRLTGTGDVSEIAVLWSRRTSISIMKGLGKPSQIKIGCRTDTPRMYISGENTSLARMAPPTFVSEVGLIQVQVLGGVCRAAKHAARYCLKTLRSTSVRPAPVSMRARTSKTSSKLTST